ncbi:hypothetical protein HG537_0B05040 [Torulaspora globosa]|uniref:Sas10 C-terminal domain-containing protein n=1 Tax=Torulaspora globosa TaxID=48254 RepID=A0A7H9HPM3_9SACH|nr:hypothetical protein HG537_0B05040 [Torulaspora sp. CBS 2947]
MGRKRSGKIGSKLPVEENYGLNEVDEFASKRDKLLFEQSNLVDDDGEDGFDNPDEEEEEVLAMSSEEDEEEEEEEELDGERAYRKVFGRKLDLGGEVGDETESMLDNDGAWSSNKGDYYGADDIEDEETAKEVEMEALRQKKKHLEELSMNDYLDEELDQDWAQSAREADVGEFKEVTKQNEKVASIEDLRNMDPDAKKEYLKVLFPEFMPLSKELSKLSTVLEELRNQEESEVISLKICALSSYLGTLSSYFGILLHELKNNDNFSTMRDHPIMEMILTSKEVWRQANALTDESDKISEQQQDGEKDELSDAKNSELNHLEKINTETQSDNDNEEPLSDEEDENDEDEDEDDVEDGEDDDEDEENDDDDDDVDLDDFEEYVKQSRLPSRKTDSKDNSHAVNDSNDYLEGEMADVDSQEKKARRRTLRFYTSKIDQSENKKIERYKGDDDIPYKERLFERQQRLLEEARKRGQQGPSSADLDSRDYNSSDEATSKAMNKESEEDFFEMTRRQRQSKKDARKQAHKDAVKAARDGKLAELAEELGEDGKRAINYQILKNKGLTPKRKKDNRNSRVKKRKKFEKAQKKLKSIRAVYSGGQSGVYEGEKTGIKKNLVKSVKFTN